MCGRPLHIVRLTQHVPILKHNSAMWCLLRDELQRSRYRPWPCHFFSPRHDSCQRHVTAKHLSMPHLPCRLHYSTLGPTKLSYYSHVHCPKRTLGATAERCEDCVAKSLPSALSSPRFGRHVRRLPSKSAGLELDLRRTFSASS